MVGQASVVQTITNAWRWSVKRDDVDKTGIVMNRNDAITRAERFIDDLIKARSKRKE